ncbi:MAG: hypothetical protein ACOYM3_00855 [Terrimicrobiaceae bacterium]
MKLDDNFSAESAEKREKKNVANHRHILRAAARIKENVRAAVDDQKTGKPAPDREQLDDFSNPEPPDALERRREMKWQMDCDPSSIGDQFVHNPLDHDVLPASRWGDLPGDHNKRRMSAIVCHQPTIPRVYYLSNHSKYSRQPDSFCAFRPRLRQLP